MATQRKVVFANDEFYHVFNRGFEKRDIFTDVYEYKRAQDLIRFYSYKDIPFRYSKYKSLTKDDKDRVDSKLSSKLVEIIAYCFMPNHFHFLLKQREDRGISSFVSNFSNSYTKYFNIRHQRRSNLLEGVFKSVHVEDDEQLVHLSRYIHLNPVTSYMIPLGKLSSYAWSSFPEYLNLRSRLISMPVDVMSYFSSPQAYIEFCFDQVGYARELKKIEHLVKSLL